MNKNLRANADWIAALKDGSDASRPVVRELEGVITRALARATRGARLGDDLSDLVQEALARIVSGLNDFRGDSAFTTWAIGIAVRVALTDLRRRRVRAALHSDFDAAIAGAEELARPAASYPGAESDRARLLTALREAIRTELSERQRVAIVAELQGIPTIEIAERLATNQNALYKLVHDARKRLKRALLGQGFSAEELHDPTKETSR